MVRSNVSHVWFACGLYVLAGGLLPGAPSHAALPVSGVEAVYGLANGNRDPRGLAVVESSGAPSEFLVLDGSGRLFTYRLEETKSETKSEKEGDAGLELQGVRRLPAGKRGHPPSGPRGLAFSREGGRRVVYFLSRETAGSNVESLLWRWGLDDGAVSSVDLSRYPMRIGDRAPFGVACDRGRLLVSFDASGYLDSDLRVLRGIVELRWDGRDGEDAAFLRHLPDAGTEPSRALACMETAGARYLWGTVGEEQIYCAEGRTGRGLFQFDRPGAAAKKGSLRGLAFSGGSLYVAEHEEPPGRPGRLYRVNVLRNLAAARLGPPMLRHLTLTIRTDPEASSEHAGGVSHNYSRPYDRGPMPNQRIWVETETIRDTSDAPNAAVGTLTIDPAGDAASRQFLRFVKYSDAPPRSYSSKYEIDIWTRPYRKFVYPHLVDRDASALKGTHYLQDDPDLFNLNDTATYDAFLARVKAHVRKKYRIDADMTNPYWAARNVVEYIQDSYYYPNREKGKPAAVDYARKHYDANPGNMKIALSARPYDKSQIIACSGTSVMVAGAMRYLGIPARWLGTGTEKGPETWDTNGNGLLDAGETAPCTNGHRYTQVWLGSRYGWVCFDATPKKPPFNDYDPLPPLQTQWRIMERCAGGHRTPKRIIFNVGSQLIRPLYRDFKYDAKLAVDNNCGGDQRYNLQARFEKPELWELGHCRIYVKNVCFIRGVELSGSGSGARVRWKLAGKWDRDPGATVSVYLQPARRGGKAVRIAASVPAEACGAAVDLARFRGKRCRLVVRKDGDEETGGQSEILEIR